METSAAPDATMCPRRCECLCRAASSQRLARFRDAPWIVVLFKQKKRQRPNGAWGPTYYATESCGIAAGMFIQAVHNMGLVTLTHTPSPMRFLREILGRPTHEEAMLVMPVGYPADDAEVPDIHRKTLDEVAVFHDEQA